MVELTQPKSCSRCGNRHTRLIPCYWRDRYWVCPECAVDLATAHDAADSWPVEGRQDGGPGVWTVESPPVRVVEVIPDAVVPPGWPRP